jgi:hypothetical protein
MSLSPTIARVLCAPKKMVPTREPAPDAPMPMPVPVLATIRNRAAREGGE